MNKRSHTALWKDFNALVLVSLCAFKAKLMSKLYVRYGWRDGVPWKTHKKIQKKEKLIRVLMTQVSNLSRFALNSQFTTKIGKVKNLIVTEKQNIFHNSFCTCNSKANLRYRNFLKRHQKEAKIINISHYHDQKINLAGKKILERTVLSFEEL